MMKGGAVLFCGHKNGAQIAIIVLHNLALLSTDEDSNFPMKNCGMGS